MTKAPSGARGSFRHLGLVGILRAVTCRAHHEPRALFLRFLAFYTLGLTCLYSIIPYKTPWCLLGFLQPLIYMAGLGAGTILRGVRYPFLQASVGALLLLGTLQLGWQSYRTNFKLYEDLQNPYVYAHTSKDLLKMVQRIEEIAASLPSKEDLWVQIIASDYWPLPWYLRGLSQVGYWDAPQGEANAPLIITDAKTHPLLEAQLEGQYTTSYFSLRPEVFLLRTSETTHGNCS